MGTRSAIASGVIGAAVLAGALIVVGLLMPTGCGPSDDGIYACTYETRYSQCGGGNYSAWETECYEFNIDDYQEGWSPERVCNKYTGSDVECGGGCCIYVDYRNNHLSSGHCP